MKYIVEISTGYNKALFEFKTCALAAVFMSECCESLIEGDCEVGITMKCNAVVAYSKNQQKRI